MRTPAVCAAALAAALAACSPEPPPAAPPVAVVHDLVAELPVAELEREVGTIDAGTAEARPFLVEGWYPDEGGDGSPTIAWSKGRSSALDFWLAAPRPLRVEMRGAAAAPPDGLPQGVSLELNGHPLRELSLAPGAFDRTVELPPTALLAGRNRLVFRYRKPVRRDNRHLAVAWDVLRLRPGRPSSIGLPHTAPPVAGEPPALVLPLGTQATFYLPLEEAGTLSLGGLVNEGGGTLQVIARLEGAAEQVLEELAGARGPRSLELPGRGARLVALSLRAVPAAVSSTGSFRVLAPAVRTRGPAPQLPPRPTAGRPNVLVYLVDTLRADHVGVYGGGALTPHVDAFAAEATVFENAIAQAPWTKPAVASLLTGRGPLEHGVRLLEDRLPREAVTAAELLQAAGYQTAAFSTNWHIRRETGMDQGFGTFDFSPDEAASDQLNRRLFPWLDRQAKAPFFLYAHALDPHEPYTPPEDFRARHAPGVRAEAGTEADLKKADASRGKTRRRAMEELRPLYAAEVAFNDHSFGALLQALRAKGLYEDTLIVFLADHGEEFNEHGARGHAKNLYAETLDIPLIVKWPRQHTGRRVASIAQQIDVLPTLLQAAGVQGPPDLPGMDLAAVAASGEAVEALTGRSVLSHLSMREHVGMSLVQGGWKLISPQTPAVAPGRELYHRVSDRAEAHNRLTAAPVRAGRLSSLLRAELERSRRTALAPEHAPIDEETRKALEALGYL